mgnify:CR=1 FL=1
MTRNVALQMDALASINPRSDTTLALGLEAQRRGYALWQYTPDRLSWREGRLFAHASRVTLHDSHEHYFDVVKEEPILLTDMDVVLMRQDPPFDMAYITATYMLESVHPKPFVANHPASVRNLAEKWFPTLFARYMPPTLISADRQAIADFHRAHGQIVVKPLYGFGGHDIVHIKSAAALDTLRLEGSIPIVAQKFLPEVSTQDKRIVLIDGEVAGLFGRIPAEGEIRANMRVGGTPVKAELTRRQQEICDAVAPVLREKGLLLAGLDVIGDWLTEINITSPTGLRAVNQLYGTRPQAQFWDALERYLP